MNILQLIQLVIQVLGKALPLPDMTDVEATEKWLQDLAGPVATIIALIAMQREDNIVASLPPDQLSNMVKEACDEQDAAIDPATVIAIITMIVKLIELWRNRRK